MALPGIAVEHQSSAPTPVGSLVVSSKTPPTGTDPHWTGGIEFAPEGCKDGVILDICSPDSDGLSDQADFITFTPYLVEVGQRASTIGFQTAEYQDRAVNKLLKSQSRLIEKEFERGAVTTAKGTGNFFLADTPTDVATILGDAGATSYTIRQGFGALEHYTQERLGGGTAMLHVPSFVLPYLTNANIVERIGNILVTKLGNIVVVGNGYSGASPSDVVDGTLDTVWLYGTDVVTLYLDTIIVSPETINEAINLSGATNKLEFRASRIAATVLNPCVDLAIKIDLVNS